MLASLVFIAGHDDDEHIRFPDHSPVVDQCVWQWALRGDVSSLVARTTDIVGVDVVRARNSWIL